MGGEAISIRDLRVDYGGFVAVRDVSLELSFGTVYGLVGPNGAGKTSLFKVLTTLMEPTYGEVQVDGLDIFEKAEAVREVIGYMPDLAPVPSDLKVGEFLDFHAETHRLGRRKFRRQRIEECLELVSLGDKRKSWCKELSRGQTQRLVLAKTLLHRPKVMVLDEPASGLDPFSRRKLREALQEMARQGAAVLVSSHILSELAEMCSSLGVMNQGNLLASGTVEEVRNKLGGGRRRFLAETFNDGSAVARFLEQRPGVDEVKVSGHEVRFDFRGDDAGQTSLISQLSNEDLSLRSFQEEKSSFEEILMGLAEENLNE